MRLLVARARTPCCKKSSKAMAWVDSSVVNVCHDLGARVLQQTGQSHISSKDHMPWQHEDERSYRTTRKEEHLQTDGRKLKDTLQLTGPIIVACQWNCEYVSMVTSIEQPLMTSRLFLPSLVTYDRNESAGNGIWREETTGDAKSEDGDVVDRQVYIPDLRRPGRPSRTRADHWSIISYCVSSKNVSLDTPCQPRIIAYW